MVTRGGHSQRLWFRTYRQRIIDGLELCRHCRRPDDPRNWLTFDHLVPFSQGRSLSFGNATILCEDCQLDKADKVWTHLISLAEEERRAPVDQQWFRIAAVARFRSRAVRNAVDRGVDGSDITLYHSTLWGVLCVKCPLNGRNRTFGRDADAVNEHITEHRAAGHHVPEWVEEDIPTCAAWVGDDRALDEVLTRL